MDLPEWYDAWRTGNCGQDQYEDVEEPECDDEENMLHIKHYRNRKLYNTQTSKYIKQSDLVIFIQKNVPFKIVSNVDSRDMTTEVLKMALLQLDLSHDTLVEIIKSSSLKGE